MNETIINKITNCHAKPSFLPVVNLSSGCGWERQALLHCFGLSVGRAAMQMCLAVRNETPLCRAGITHNVWVCAVAGIGGLKNGAIAKC